MIVLELLVNGDLKSYLNKRRYAHAVETIHMNSTNLD